jgi:predicted DNA-binding transcriptional regulator AlpA
MVKLVPRLLSREDMASYLRCSESTVDQLVEDGLIPPPQKWRSLTRWDKVAVDRVLDRVYGVGEGAADEFSIAEAINGRAPARALRRNSPQ